MAKKRELSSVNYASGTVPSGYKCDKCGVRGVKLWREYQTLAEQTDLLCASCAEADQKKSHKQGWESPFSKGEGDQIGWMIAAVPVEGENTYWGYTSVPPAGCEWWDSLPTKPGEIISLTDKKIRMLMNVVDRMIYRHYQNRFPNDKQSYELRSLGRSIFGAKDEEALQAIRVKLATLK